MGQLGEVGLFSRNVKPSGLPYGQCSAEDVELALAGFNYDLDPNAPKVSYLRIKSLENWIGTSWMEILEVSVFGDPPVEFGTRKS